MRLHLWTRCAAHVAVAMLAWGSAAHGDDAAETGGRAASGTARCGMIEVVDERGRPVRSAEVRLLTGDPADGAPVSDIDGGFTNERGRFCGEKMLWGDGFLVIDAPAMVGGECAGVKRMWLPDWPPKGPPKIRVVLALHPLERFAWRGPVVGPDFPP